MYQRSIAGRLFRVQQEMPLGGSANGRAERDAGEEREGSGQPAGGSGRPAPAWARYRLAMSRKHWMSAFCVPEK
jgi:hypothetical protein